MHFLKLSVRQEGFVQQQKQTTVESAIKLMHKHEQL